MMNKDVSKTESFRKIDTNSSAKISTDSLQDSDLVIDESVTPKIEEFRRTLRALYRIIMVIGWTFLLYITWLLGRGVKSMTTGKVRKWRECMFQSWSSGLLRILGIRVSVRGSVPEEQCVIVSNHLSYLDIPVLASEIKTVFVAKSEVSEWTIMGTLTSAMDTIFVDRENPWDLCSVVEEMNQALERGEQVTFFPEGTSTRGRTVREFHSSLFASAVREQKPVWPISINYRIPDSDILAGEKVCFSDNDRFGGHLWSLLKLPEIQVSLDFTNPVFEGPCRKRIADQAESIVETSFLTLNRNS